MELCHCEWLFHKCAKPWGGGGSGYSVLPDTHSVVRDQTGHIVRPGYHFTISLVLLIGAYTHTHLFICVLCGNQRTIYGR